MRIELNFVIVHCETLWSIDWKYGARQWRVLSIFSHSATFVVGLYHFVFTFHAGILHCNQCGVHPKRPQTQQQTKTTTSQNGHKLKRPQSDRKAIPKPHSPSKWKVFWSSNFHNYRWNLNSCIQTIIHCSWTHDAMIANSPASSHNHDTDTVRCCYNLLYRSFLYTFLNLPNRN